MSQFLWVEDFGDVDVDATATSVFGGILANQSIPNNQFRLRKLLAEQGVLLKLDFVEALEFIRNPEELLRIDYIILDIWLPVDTTKNTTAETGEYLQTLLQRYDADKQTASEELEKMAGYQLYVELIMEIGFPKEHILFCSNHAEELSSISQAFGEAKLKLLEIPTKQREEDIATVQNWVKRCRENPYSVLRRGILNVLDDIEGNVNCDLTEPFQKEVPVNKDTFLEGLRFMLNSHRIPSEAKRQHLFKALCDYLTKYFDRFSGRDLYRGKYKGNGFEMEVPKAYTIPLYFIRNWVAHNILNNANSAFSEQDVGFLFMQVVKGMFDYSSIERFQLLYRYPVVNDSDLQTCLIDLQNRHYSYSGQCEIFELIRLKGERKRNRNVSTEDFVAHKYASFLFCCVELRTRTKAKSFTDNMAQREGLGYWVNLTYHIDSQGDNLFESLKSIAYHRLKEKNF